MAGKESKGHPARLAPPPVPAGPEERAHSRREFFRKTGLAAAAAALAKSALFLPGCGGQRSLVMAVQSGPLYDTFHGLEAFVVPGTDDYSVHQGVSTPEPGAVDAGITDVLIQDLDLLVPFLPQFSAQVAGILDAVAHAINPAPVGPFTSPFANLSFQEKVVVFAVMESGLIDPALGPLAAGLLQFVGFLSYSEAGVFDPATGALTGTPLGWTLSNYSGVSDGHDEFKGYYQNRRKVS
jgi:hypothetical protein